MLYSLPGDACTGAVFDPGARIALFFRRIDPLLECTEDFEALESRVKS
jgi:hypothetical protein